MANRWRKVRWGAAIGVVVSLATIAPTSGASPTGEVTAGAVAD